MAKSYYKVIEGVRYDREMLDIAEEAVAGKGDGRISIEDVQKLYEAIIDGDKITDIEQTTLDYIKENFRITEAAAKWLEDELAVWKKNHPKKDDQAEKADKPKPEKPAAVETSPELALRGEATKPGDSDRTTHSKPPEASAQTSKPSLILPIIIVSLLIALPIAYFVGKNTAIPKEDPIMQARLNSLQSQLTQSQNEVLALKSEVSRLNQEQNQVTSLEQEITELKAQISDLESNQAETVQPVAIPAATQNKTGIADELSRNLATFLNSGQILFDEDELRIEYLPDDPFFTGDGTDLSGNLKSLLSDTFPLIVQTAMKHDNVISGIQIRGHSSSDWLYANNNQEAYLNNMKLSAERAVAVQQFCMGLDSVASDWDWLAKTLVNSGLSDSQPVKDDSGNEDALKSRRISIVIGLNQE